MLTPGQTEKHANLSFSYSIAYYAVRLFRAALEISYVGYGAYGPSPTELSSYSF
jgi:hypothetical protein